MKSYLKGIVLFDKHGEKRSVKLKEGINIIEGDSKTGKSALVEIIDYCLCSSRCTVPKGKITSFTNLYCIILVVGEVTYVIGRQRWDNGAKMYFEKESSNYEVDELEKTYFDDKTLYNSKQVQRKIERILGLEVSNLESDDEKEKKASLRNMVSYLFQHQNLIASKFALFYRFSDFYKRKDIIEQFPIFAGFIGQEYYSDIITLRKLKLDLKKAKKVEESNKKVKEKLKKNLLPLIKDYYSLLDLDFDDKVSFTKLKKLIKNLPEFDENELYKDTGIIDRYDKLNRELEKLRDLKRDTLLEIKHLSNINNNGNNFNGMLRDLQHKNSTSSFKTQKYICPLCGNACNDLEHEDEEINKAVKWLDKEIKVSEKYTEAFSEDIRKLNLQKDSIDAEINFILKQIKDIENKFIKSKSLVSKREKINYAKAKIDLYIDMMNDNVFQIPDKDIEELDNEIKILEKKIDGFDIKTKMKKAEVFLSNNMNNLALGLDFEKEYSPINLNFDLEETFNLYQFQDNQKISLDEMGSGANWISCHIALFLSFLRFFTEQKEKSPMPLIMFFDQPSQVYFPDSIDKNKNTEQSISDITAVNNMYKTIFNEIDSIKTDTGILPQLIIVDHVDGELLEVKKQFREYRRYNWRNNEALI